MAKSRVVVLGCSGMLGQQVAREFSENYPAEVIRVGRSGDVDVRFNFLEQSSAAIAKEIGLQKGDWLINCIGWIPQKSVSPSVDERLAYSLNVDLPKKLDQLAGLLGVRVLQVGTDCVFDGSQGHYNELSKQVPIDLYSETKILGEKEQSNSMVVRSSIIGVDVNSTSGLFSWFISQAKSASVNGYLDHYWNGVTTKAMASIFRGIVEQEAFKKGTWHLVPKNYVSKFELLTMFKELMSIPIIVVPVNSPGGPRDRTLSTRHPEVSESLWKLGGYPGAPTIFDLVDEMVSDYLKRSVDDKI